MYSDKQQAFMEQHEQNQNERAATSKSSSRTRLQEYLKNVIVEQLRYLLNPLKRILINSESEKEKHSDVA